jgi:hypothetical protein
MVKLSNVKGYKTRSAEVVGEAKTENVQFPGS